MLFQGQEFASSSPFLFFADHPPELAEAVRKGRADFLANWPSLASGTLKFADPCDETTFEMCKLDHSERERNQGAVRLHTDLLRLRREELVFQRQARRLDGAVLSPEAFVLRFFGDRPEDDRLLLVNFGRDVRFVPAPEPLLAPAEKYEWRMLWSSEDPQYGGSGTALFDAQADWFLAGHAAAVLATRACTPETRTT